jgi:LacI family gluconate utilization system Gnt-I transcriptional repressor
MSTAIDLRRPRVTARVRRRAARATMTEVAAAAAVSPSTVSLYLRKPAAVSGELGRRIQHVIDRTGYVPNLAAGGLAAARTRVVGVIVPSMINAFFAGTIETLEAALGRSGHQLLLGNSHYSVEREEALVRAFLAWSPAAMVLTGVKHTRNTARLLVGADIPVVEMWELAEAPLDVVVGFSHHEVGRAMARHLYARGCRAVAFVGARMKEDRRAHARRNGYEAVVRETGRHEAIVVDVPEPAQAAVGARALAAALAAHPEIDGVCCSNDTLALGALAECKRRGIAVPRELAVIGFGDLDFAGQSIPALTTVRPPREDIGRVCAELLAVRLAGGEPPQRVHDLGFELVARESG